MEHDLRFGVLSISGARGGPASEIATFMRDMNSAYLCLLRFPSQVISSIRSRAELNMLNVEKVARSAVGRVNPTLEQSMRSEASIPPQFRLLLVKATIQSPGLWAFLGSLHPLETIRNFYNDYHEHKKDNLYRNQAEAERLRLENEARGLQNEILVNQIFRERFDMLTSAGMSEVQAWQMIWETGGAQLAQLGTHVDSGLIDARPGTGIAAVQVLKEPPPHT